MEGDSLHECTEFDQLDTCKECGALRTSGETARFSGGAGARTSHVSDEDYRRAMNKLSRGE